MSLTVGWLFWVYKPFETVFQSISGRFPNRGRKTREKIDVSKNVQTTLTRTYCKHSRPLSYCNPNCRTPWHWKFTQHHRTTDHPVVNRTCMFSVRDKIAISHFYFTFSVKLFWRPFLEGPLWRKLYSYWYCICVGRFRILGGQGLEYYGAKAGSNSQQAHDVISASFPTRF